MSKGSFVLWVTAGSLLATGAVARAEPPPQAPVLVELFTSQGCSSCPAADAFVRALPSLGLGRDKVVPLTFHVDYWDGLGWKDRFASAAFTRRQEWYAEGHHLRSPDGRDSITGLYTPQMIVAGSVHFSGQRHQTARDEIARAARHAVRALPVEASVTGGVACLAVETRAFEAMPDEDWRLVGALAQRSARTVVERGENAGEILEEAAVVRRLSDRMRLTGAGRPTVLRLEKPSDLPWSDLDLVVFVQSEKTGEVAAVRTLDGRQLAGR